MKIRIGRLVLAVFATLFAGEVAAQCNPGPGHAAFFVDANYHGQCVVLAIGDFPTAESIGLPNDSISSIRVGTGTQVYACRDHYFQGTCELITTDVPGLGNHTVGNDTITSLKVQAHGASTACVPGASQAALFIDANFSGGCVVRGTGSYPTSESIGLPNDSISSFKLGATAQVIACRDNNYGGNCQLFTNDIAYLGGQPIGNDTISSVKIQPRGAQDCKPGPQQVGFFMHDNFLSPCSLRNIGSYPNAATLGLPNDSLSSVLIGQGAQVILCVDDNFGGDCQRFTTNNPHLGNSRIGNDRASSAKVQRAGEYDCTAGPGQVAFFVNDDMIGPCSVRGIGEYPTPESLGVPNDSLSSIMVGSNTQVVLCVDNNYLNDCQKFTASDPHLGNSRIGNDRVSSARVQQLGTIECPPAANQVAVYMHADFLAPCLVRNIGNYPNAAAIGLADNSISSIRVGRSVQACGCDDENYATTCQAFTSDVSYLGNSSGNWNDRISSLKVTALGAPCQAVVTTPHGVKQAQITNCNSEKRSVEIWIYDAATNSYSDKGSAPSNWSGDSCTFPSLSPFTVSLPAGHQVTIIGVDPQLVACGGQTDPTISACQKLITSPMLGDANGTTAQIQID
jgi:hypothetical protein